MGRPPELLNSDEQLIGMGREIAPERRGLRTRRTWETPWAFIEGQGKPEESGVSSDLRALMAAVPCGSNGH